MKHIISNTVKILTNYIWFRYILTRSRTFIVFRTWLKTQNTLTTVGSEQCNLTPIRPGLNKAWSMRSGREVAAIIQTPSKVSMPSNWVKNWLTTLSVTPVWSEPRL